MTCRHCDNLVVMPDKSGRRVPRKNYAYTCGAGFDEPKLPHCVTKAHGWRWPPSRTKMMPDSGEGCPMFTPVKK